MVGYFGTETQQRLQAKAEDSADFIARTSGACQAGGTMGCDDPKQFGWNRITEIVAQDGVCGFRLIDTGEVPSIRTELGTRGCRFDTWDVFLADSARALAALRNITTRQLPEGLSVLDTPSDPEGILIKNTQVMMARSGLVPFSGSMLVGEIGRSVTVIIGNDEEVVATAHGYMPHNSFSAYHRHAWGGLVAVVERYRGKGLGKLVNALMIDRVFRELAASHVYDLVSSSNHPSRRMVEACGLRLEPALTCGIATPHESGRFTK